MKNDIENLYDSPILVIGYRGFPINRFCYDVIYKGEITSRYNVSHSDNMHDAYLVGFEDFKKAMEKASQLYRIEKYTGTLEQFVTRKYFKSWVKRKMYSLYLSVGKLF